jgi:hypothetical protein
MKNVSIIPGDKYKYSVCYGFATLFSLMTLSQARADEDFPDLQLQGLLDFRYIHADGEKNWFDGGLGKFRYGNGQSSNLVNLDQAALEIHSRLDWSWSSRLTVKYADRQENPVDLTEALLIFRPVSTSQWRFNGKLGAFFPPVSLENSGVAWTSPYTLSSSAINSWVGEELKVFGGEAQMIYQRENGDKFGLMAAGFGNNDTAGVLLAWRGWSLDDYTATLNDQYQISNAGNLHTLFPKQAEYTKPFSEVDGRPGYYAGFSVERPELGKFRAMYYDNRGKPSAVVDGQYAWHTRFASLGLKIDLPWELELIGQGMFGRTQMGNQIGGLFAVDTQFWSHSLLLSKHMGPHRLSFRYDGFGTSENDYFPQDPNIESGHAFTFNYNITLEEHHQLNFELNHIASDRAARSYVNQLNLQNQTLWQVAYRLFF